MQIKLVDFIVKENVIYYRFNVKEGPIAKAVFVRYRVLASIHDQFLDSCKNRPVLSFPGKNYSLFNKSEEDKKIRFEKLKKYFAEVLNFSPNAWHAFFRAEIMKSGSVPVDKTELNKFNSELKEGISLISNDCPRPNSRVEVKLDLKSQNSLFNEITCLNSDAQSSPPDWLFKVLSGLDSKINNRFPKPKFVDFSDDLKKLRAQ